MPKSYSISIVHLRVAITKLTIEEFIPLCKQFPVFDVRSEGEFEHAHIPGAYSLPLFNNEERKQEEGKGKAGACCFVEFSKKKALAQNE